MSAVMITLNQWEEAGLTYDQLRRQVRNGNIITERAGKGKPLTINLNSVPTKYFAKIEKSMPSEREKIASILTDAIEPDEKALSFYSNYALADGRSLPDNYIREYTTNAQVFNALINIKAKQEKAMKALGKKPKAFFQQAAESLLAAQDEIGHTIPCANKKGEPNSTVLKRKFDLYVADGYSALISKKFCNDNSRKVTDRLEKLLMAIYRMPNKPFATEVHLHYYIFMQGGKELVDKKTGEVFSPSEFMMDGQPILVSESTVWNYLNMPHNRALVDKGRNSGHSFNNMHRPHHSRLSPNYSFSKVSLDDRDLPRKLVTNDRVKAYYAYDVASGAIIGASYSRFKNEELFIDCLRDMFRLIDTNDFPMPMEVEVENHLVSKFFDDLHVMFPYVRICNPGNSQEKRAEHFNRAKKYGVEKKSQHGIGRWWARSEAYRVDQDKVNDEFQEKKFTYERLVADDKQAIDDYNNQLHPKQKTYPGKTRWQVLLENLNPTAPQVSKAVIYKSIGEKTQTTIVRNFKVRVQYDDYAIPGPQTLEKLKPNNYSVDAYWLAGEDGAVREVYLYQGNTFICKAERLSRYNEAKAEWTEMDHVAYVDQAKYVANFDSYVKTRESELPRLEMIPVIATPQEVVIVDETPQEDNTQDLLTLDFDYAAKALNDI
jgi:hypothetical protein